MFSSVRRWVRECKDGCKALKRYPMLRALYSFVNVLSLILIVNNLTWLVKGIVYSAWDNVVFSVMSLILILWAWVVRYVFALDVIVEIRHDDKDAK